MAERLKFGNSQGQDLAALLDAPEGEARACALFAHCFTCSKEINAAATIGQTLAAAGIATLRFDFTGLGESEGDFSATNFTTNVEDLVHAAQFLLSRYPGKPLLLIGHSLGGSAALSATSRIAQTRAAVTLGAPMDPEHVGELLGDARLHAQKEGSAPVRIAGRTFQVTRQFLEDIAAQNMSARISSLTCPLLILHSPADQVVGFENAQEIFAHAPQPKSLVCLDGMDHLISRRGDRQYVGRLIAAWAERYLSPDAPGTG